MPSWMEPTIAMAPMHTVSELVTNPSTKELSPSLPVLARSHTPRSSKRLSRLMASPISDPAAKEETIIIDPVETSAPLSSASMPDNAPASPTKSTLTPVAFMRVSCTRGVKSPPPSMPTTPPTTMSATLMMVPSPITCTSLFPAWGRCPRSRWTLHTVCMVAEAPCPAAGPLFPPRNRSP